MFKAFARALRMAVARDPRAAGVDSVDQGHAVALGRGSTTRCRRSSSSTTAWATCARSRRRSRTSRRTATIVVSRRPGRHPRAPTASCCPGQSAMPDCMQGLDRERPARRRARGAARPPVPRHLPRPADAVRRERGGPTACLGALPGDVVRFRDDAMTSPAASGSRCRTWAGARSPGAAASALGGHRGRRAVLFRAQLPSRARGSGADRRRRPIIRRRLLAPLRGLISSLRSSIRKRASAQDSRCSPTSSPGTAR